ncbi:hypothetical protein INT46_008187 [Mucor plumbeus]|uniref:Uncharacterized protein n=1 Tax=Mucor plumbeus TaxID=97098 RepID=A0A8H7RH71_9FUNG|nr:hypothetical protein INT46_008187 [Mucor plumbeus]
MQETYEQLPAVNGPVNLEQAEFIISLSSKKNGAFKSMMHLLRQMESQIETRRKQNNHFYQVVHAVDERYRRKIHTNQQLAQRIHSEITYIVHDMDQLTCRRASLKEELDAHEQDLNDIRDYAELRRNKKSKRERQYHQLYHVPLVAAQYKKKYVRARDKNSDAEEKVSEIRAVVDSCQRAISELSKSLGDCQRKREQLTLNQQDVQKQSKETQELMITLQDGCKFWQGFDQHQSITAQKAITHFIEYLQRNSTNNNALRQSMDPNNDIVKLFKMALYGYGEAEKYADKRWSNLNIEFDCAKCQVSQIGWPKPDKVRPSNLLCAACYQEHRTSMIWEKKMTGVSQQLLNLPGGSMLSFSSQSTLNSTSSSNDDTNAKNNKPGFKKMFQMLKGNKKKRSSSNDSTSSETIIEPQRNNRMMMA